MNRQQAGYRRTSSSNRGESISSHVGARLPALADLSGKRWRGETGTSMIEVLTAVAVSMILAAFTLPSARTALSTFQLNAAATGAAAAIQSTRYQAIMKGYPFAISFDPGTMSYQVSSRPLGAPGFSNVGGSIPLAPNAQLTLSATTAFQFVPNGTVTVTAGSSTFSISNSANSKTITVSGVGNVTVTP